jgi:lipoprotein-releasing system permease protein
MRFEAFVATRYLRGKRKNRFVSLITIISVAGVAVGVMTLIVVMAVMTGFDIELRNTIIGNRAHLRAFPAGGQKLYEWREAVAQIRQLSPEVSGAGPLVETEALLKNGNLTTGCLVMGIEPELERDITDLETNLSNTAGRKFGEGKPPADKEVVLGYRLAQRIGATVGSEVAVFTPRVAMSALGARRGGQVYLKVSGISQARMSEFDSLYAFVNIATAQMLTGRDGVDAIHVKLDNPDEAEQVAALIEENLPFGARTWYEDQEAYFRALEQEKLVMFVILSFVVLVAAFNITSTLIMVVMEKRRDIGILRTLGASTQSILGLFILNGLMIGLSGTVAGVVGGTLFITFLNPIAVVLAAMMGVELDMSQIYYFDHIPAVLVPMDVAVIAGTAVVLSFVSTLYPAWSAARLNPVDALRHE